MYFVIFKYYSVFCLLCRKSQLAKSDNVFRQSLMFLIKNLKKYEFIKCFCPCAWSCVEMADFHQNCSAQIVALDYSKHNTYVNMFV